jgi:dihydroneopterin aldolase
MMTVSLNEVQFKAYHGLYPEERSAGAVFSVSLDVGFPEKEGHGDIRDTVDYTVLYELVSGRMDRPLHLLEDLAMAIASDVRERYPFISEIQVKITKLHPPIIRFQGHVSVTLHKIFTHD